MSNQKFDNWRTSSYTSGGGACVEVASTADRFGVRDTKDRRPDRPLLVFASAAGQRFVAAAKAGRLDL